MRVPVVKILKWTVIALAVVFAGLQFIRPARTNPPVDESRTILARTRTAPEVASILERSCNDCHSNQTRWPWYSQIAPVSWFVVNHVNVGRREMNLSDWAQYSANEQRHFLNKIYREVKSGQMPLSSYVRLHGEAKLSSEDIGMLCDWARAETGRLAGSDE